ncbi:ATP-dependent DNA helicase PIF1 [Purpureocillium lavendulum]|uniref:ATP-dependent DNA helicase PIF1 n=1 Tax=Purpureocillium lavendulum TaxID=1247861 RepID=A0AB34FEK7_9HYPO|nr:ATP-dependent DNA helicase PIF1 [Purpureocillium lavendulum]
MSATSTQLPATLVVRALPAPLEVSQYTKPSIKTVTVDEEHSFPCRRCLKDGAIGDKMLLTPYDPWLGDSPYRQPGPIFVHLDPTCGPYKPDGRLPEQLRRRLLSVRSFGKDHCMVDADVVQGDQLVSVAERMMKDEAAEYIHVHNARPGCFAARIERSGA